MYVPKYVYTVKDNYYLNDCQNHTEKGVREISNLQIECEIHVVLRGKYRYSKNMYMCQKIYNF